MMLSITKRSKICWRKTCSSGISCPAFLAFICTVCNILLTSLSRTTPLLTIADTRLSSCAAKVVVLVAAPTVIIKPITSVFQFFISFPLCVFRILRDDIFIQPILSFGLIKTLFDKVRYRAQAFFDYLNYDCYLGL